jgi:hypothetical protein
MLCLAVTTPSLSKATTKPSEYNKILYYEDQFSKRKYRKKNRKNDAHGEEDLYVIFKVDLKCQKELEPSDILLELINKSSLDDDTRHYSHTMEDSSADFGFKPEIH